MDPSKLLNMVGYDLACASRHGSQLLTFSAISIALIAKAAFKGYKAVGGADGLQAVGLKHCNHCKELLGPCQCSAGCPIPIHNLRKSKCFAVQTGIVCDSCSSEGFQGPRFKCQVCADYDLCLSCYEGCLHDPTHAFFKCDRVGTPSVPMSAQANACASLDQESASSYSLRLNSSSSSSQSSHPLSADEAVASSRSMPVGGTASYYSEATDTRTCSTRTIPVGIATLHASGPNPVVLEVGSKSSRALPNRSAAAFHASLPVIRTCTEDVVHRNICCDGPNCPRSKQSIRGPLYTCAVCSLPVDLCQACYHSRTAHTTSHGFRRFDDPNKPHSFVMCKPQIQERLQQWQQQQQRREQIREQPPNNGSVSQNLSSKHVKKGRHSSSSRMKPSSMSSSLRVPEQEMAPSTIDTMPVHKPTQKTNHSHSSRKKDGQLVSTQTVSLSSSLSVPEQEIGPGTMDPKQHQKPRQKSNQSQPLKMKSSHSSSTRTASSSSLLMSLVLACVCT